MSKVIAVLAVLAWAVAAPAWAADYHWTAGSSDWKTAGNWNPVTGPPGAVAADRAMIINGSVGTPSVVNVADPKVAALLGIGTDPVTLTGAVPNVWSYWFDGYWGAYGASAVMPVIPATGSYNSVVVGAGGSLTVTDPNGAGAIMLGYRCNGDYNKLIVENGGVVTADWLVAGGNVYVGLPQPIHNEVRVRNGGVLNLLRTGSGPAVGPDGEFADSDIMAGTFEVSDGTVNVSGGLSVWGAIALNPSNHVVLLRSGELNAHDFMIGYQPGTLRIGDGKLDPNQASGGVMRLHMNGGYLTAFGGYEASATPLDPDDPNGAKYAVGVALDVKSDGILSGNILGGIFAADGQKPHIFRVSSGGTMDPGAANKSTPGEMMVSTGTLQFMSGSNLDIDLFSAISNDKVTANKNPAYTDLFTGDDPNCNYNKGPWDMRTKNALNIQTGAKMNISLQGGYIPGPGTSWDVLTWNTRVGTFDIANNTGYDWLTFSMDYNDVTGIGTLTVLPEPATLALLALGGLLAIRRRR